jgi:class 3 adenylate cyclase
MNAVSESEAEALFLVLRQSADLESVAAIEALVRTGPDRALNRVNVLDFAAKRGLDEGRVIAAFLHAARVGLCDLSWNVLCPGCSGVLHASSSLKTIHADDYGCALCSAGYEPTLDEMVEVSFTVNPRVRRIPSHEPHTLPIWDYMRQVFWSSGIDLPEEKFEDLINQIVVDSIEVPPGERASLSLQLPAEFVIVFEPVTHSAQFLDVKGEPTRERQHLTMVFNKVSAPNATLDMRPGPLKLSLENRTDLRVLPAVWIAGEGLHELLGKRRPFLTAKRLLTNQAFRDIYRTDTLDVDQRLKITSLTFLFTDLRSSTEMYERLGDIVAYDLVRTHFQLLKEIIAAEAGAVVRITGDGAMATFPTPDRAVAAALRIRDEMERINLVLKIGIHEGPCLAVTFDDRQDYFGQTVNIASRVQGLAASHRICATRQVVEYPGSSSILKTIGLKPVPQLASLRGIADELVVYEIP